MSTRFPNLACKVVLPDDYYAARGGGLVYVGAEGEQRQFARRDLRVFAVMQHAELLPGLPRRRDWQGVYTLDISHGGIGFYHSEQLYPRERVRIVLPEGAIGRLVPDAGPRLVEIARCCFVQPHCYAVGGTFIEGGG